MTPLTYRYKNYKMKNLTFFQILTYFHFLICIHLYVIGVIETASFDSLLTKVS